jgi:integrase
VNGGPRWYETIGPDRREAEQALALRLAEINRGTYRERKVATFHGFASEWFAGHRRHLRPSAVERMRNDLEVHLLPFFGEYLLDQIGAELIERYMSEKVAEHAGGGGLSNVSINKTLTLLRQVLSAGVRYGYLDRNPVDDVRRLKVEKKSQAFLQLDQIDALLDATPEKDQPFLWTLLLSGLRIGEALALRWGDLEALAPEAQHRPDMGPGEQARGRRAPWHRGSGQDGEEGSVAIGDFLLKTLLDHKTRSPFSGEDNLVFPTSKGEHQNPSNFRRRVLAPVLEKANARLRQAERPLIPPITPHSLRHTYCSLLISRGEDISTVAAQMRHADVSTTLKVYTHVMKHRREGVAGRLDDLVFGHRARAPKSYSAGSR